MKKRKRTTVAQRLRKKVELLQDEIYTLKANLETAARKTRADMEANHNLIARNRQLESGAMMTVLRERIQPMLQGLTPENLRLLAAVQNTKQFKEMPGNLVQEINATLAKYHHVPSADTTLLDDSSN